jgi:WD40 repeat protein
MKTFRSCSVAVGKAGQVASALVGIRYWKTQKDEFVDVQFPNEKANVVQAAFAANGDLLVGRTDENLHVKDLRSGKTRSVRTGKMDALKVASKGYLAVYKRTHNKIYLADLRTMKVHRLVSYDGPVHGLAISADGSRVAVGNLATGSPSYLEIWDTRSRRRLKKLVVEGSDHEGFPMECDQCLAIGAHNGVLVVGSQSKIHLWNLRNWRKVEGLLTRGPGRWGKDRTVSAVDLVGRVLAAGYEDGTVKVWDLCVRKSICTH